MQASYVRLVECSVGVGLLPHVGIFGLHLNASDQVKILARSDGSRQCPSACEYFDGFEWRGGVQAAANVERAGRWRDINLIKHRFDLDFSEVRQRAKQTAVSDVDDRSYLPR